MLNVTNLSSLSACELDHIFPEKNNSNSALILVSYRLQTEGSLSFSERVKYR